MFDIRQHHELPLLRSGALQEVCARHTDTEHGQVPARRYKIQVSTRDPPYSTTLASLYMVSIKEFYGIQLDENTGGTVNIFFIEIIVRTSLIDD